MVYNHVPCSTTHDPLVMMIRPPTPRWHGLREPPTQSPVPRLGHRGGVPFRDPRSITIRQSMLRRSVVPYAFGERSI